MNHLEILSNRILGKLPSGVMKPAYDRNRLEVGIVHIGIGAFHRAHQAWFMDHLLRQGLATDWAICGIGILPGDQRICNVLDRQDGLYCLKMVTAEGASKVQIIGSIIETIYGPEHPLSAIERMASPATKIISLTITEGGYNFSSDRKFDWGNKQVLWDLEEHTSPKTVFGYLSRALRLRRDYQSGPITIQSCDNMESNGDVTRIMVLEFISKADPDLAGWVQDNVSFPNSMVDRITPATTESLKKEIAEDYGFADGWPVHSEDFSQWVIEDNFMAGRPEWEIAGAQMVENVAPYEKMKIRLLNGGHTLVGFAGYFAGYNYIHESVGDTKIRHLLKKYLDEEVTPTLDPVYGIDLKAYKDSIIRRFSNPHIKDTVARIISETSAKFPRFILPTIIDQIHISGKVAIAALIAANWYRYLQINLELQDTIEDASRQLLLASVTEAEEKNDPTIFLQNRNLFGELQNSGVFHDFFLHHLLKSVPKT